MIMIDSYQIPESNGPGPPANWIIHSLGMGPPSIDATISTL